MSASYDHDLAIDHSERSRRLIQTDWYNSLLEPDDKGQTMHILRHKSSMSNFENNFGGYRLATSVGGKATGGGANWIIIDDPLSQQEGMSEAFRKRAIEWFDGTMWTRLNDPDVDIRIIVMQRLHEEDITGHIIDKFGDGRSWKVICLPAQADQGEILPPELKKFYVNGLLFPSRLHKERLRKDKFGLGSYLYAAQFSQRPAPLEGGIFKKIYWNFWKPADMDLPHVQTKLEDGTIHTHELVNLPEKFDDIIGSCDLAFKGTAGSDRVSFGKWASRYTHKYLLDNICDNMSYVETRKALIQFYNDNPEMTSILIEDKANGPAVMDDLDLIIPNMLPVNPLGSKVGRALVVDGSKGLSMVAQAEAGHIFLPHPVIAPWIWDWILEYALFPNGKKDDRVDDGTQAVNHLTHNAMLGIYTSADYERDMADQSQKERPIGPEEEPEISISFTHDGSNGKEDGNGNGDGDGSHIKHAGDRLITPSETPESLN